MSNVFSFTGTVGRDAEVRYAPSGVAILNVTVANNIGFGDKQQTLWVRVVVFGKRAEGKLVDYLKKGQQVFVSGELTQSEYKASDGTAKTSLELNATILDLISKKSEGEQTQQRQQPQQRPTKAPVNDLPYDDFDDSIPF
jgi:single-strand DNA-binding protein